MEIYIKFPFLDLQTFLLVLITSIQMIILNIFIFIAVWRYRKNLKYSRLLLVSSAIALSFLMASFFMPSISATNISEDDLIILSNIFTLYTTLLFIPTAILPSISLLIYGWVNKREYNYFLFISGIHVLVFNLWSYINSIIQSYIWDYPTPPFTPLDFFYMFILPYIFIAILIQAFIIFIIHGLLNKQSSFRNVGIIMVNFIILFQILYPFLIGWVFRTFH